MTEKYDLQWYGTLTLKNVRRVAELFRELLKDKRFAIVDFNSASIDTGQRLLYKGSVADSIRVSIFRLYPKGATLYIATPDCTWVIEVDDRRLPHVVFNRDRVKITHWSDDGRELHWAFIVEPGDKR